MEVCKILPRVYACMEYISARPTAALEALQQHRKNNHPATQRHSRDRLVNVLRGEILSRQQAEGNGWWDDIESSIVDNVTDQYHGGNGEFYDKVGDYRQSIYQAHVVDGSLLQPTRRDEDQDSDTDLLDVIHSVRFPFWLFMDRRPPTPDYANLEEVPPVPVGTTETASNDNTSVAANLPLPDHQLVFSHAPVFPRALPLPSAPAPYDMIEVSALHFPPLHQSTRYCLPLDSTEHGRVKGLQ